MGLGEAIEWAVFFAHSVYPDTAKFRVKLWKTRRTLAQGKEELLQCLSHIQGLS